LWYFQNLPVSYIQKLAAKEYGTYYGSETRITTDRWLEVRICHEQRMIGV
jgi:hypothetical protein